MEKQQLETTRKGEASLSITDGDFRLFLQDLLISRCKGNPAYSLRAFSRQLKIESSLLSKILSGKRPLTQKMIERLSVELCLDPAKTKQFQQRHKRNISSNNKQPLTFDHAQDLTLDTFQMISDWYHFAILELTKTKGFQSRPSWIAKKLGIKTIEAQSALERLTRLQMIERSVDGRILPVKKAYSNFSSPFTHAAFRKLQKQILEQAIQALEEIPIEKRDQSSLTMAIDISRIEEAKEKIKRFRVEMSQLLQPKNAPKEKVYQLSVSLFPVTKGDLV